jgi:hypothetical protein
MMTIIVKALPVKIFWIDFKGVERLIQAGQNRKGLC